jgi:type VI secretion system protein ImpM
MGLYGKLPSHGDFVARDLPPSFINVWDEWLQRGMLCSQEELGDKWLEIYLTSPIWRFSLSPGVIDNNNWAGIMIPSVDRVGRYFPFTLLAQLPDELNGMDVISSETGWYRELENLALEGLDGHLDVDEIYAELSSIKMLNAASYKTNSQSQAASSHLSIEMDFDEQLPSSVYPALLDYLLRRDGQSYSIWHSLGSDMVNPCMLLSKGLPPARGLTALIDGQWQQHNWFMPVESLLPVMPTEQSIPEEIF